MLILQLSDAHITRSGELCLGAIDTFPFLQRAIDRVLTWPRRPDVVLFTGDLSEDGSDDAYGRAKMELERLERLVYVVPGNHDLREPMRAALRPDHAYLPETGFLNFTADLGPVALVGLDTLEGTGAGRLCPERLAWAEAALAELRGRPTLLMMHHPPVRLGLPFMDRYPCKGGEALAPMIERHGAVQAILCGHAHRTLFTRFGGAPLLLASGVAHQFLLDVLGDATFGFVLEPPGCLVHDWRPEGRLVSHFVPLGAFGPVHPLPRSDRPARSG